MGGLYEASVLLAISLGRPSFSFFSFLIYYLKESLE